MEAHFHSAKCRWERWLARAYAMTGRQTEVDRLIAAHGKDPDPYHLAIIYAGLHDKERTFDALNGAADRADSRAPAFLFSPETGIPAWRPEARRPGRN